MFQEEESGVEPSRAEIFIASRTRKDGSMVCEEARICAVSTFSAFKITRAMLCTFALFTWNCFLQEKLKEVMNKKLPGETSLKNDAIAQVFGPEHSGRVRCLGRGVTPSTYISSLESTSTINVEIVEIKSTVKNLADKVDIVASALQAYIGLFNALLDQFIALKMDLLYAGE